MSGLEFLGSEEVVGVEVIYDMLIICMIIDVNIDVVWVIIGILQFIEQDLLIGDLNGFCVMIVIDLQMDGGGFVQVFLDIIDDKCISCYQCSYWIELFGDGLWDVWFCCVSVDSIVVVKVNNVFWDLMIEFIDLKFCFLMIVGINLQINVEQFW